ncbi:MAG: class I SAM-dependent methyltransferase [Clostridia bacterium]|nr:class I SAM-dependent methyltransferase [Clostridia bacterium]
MDELLNIRTEGYMNVGNPVGYAEYDATPYSILEKMVQAYPFAPEDCFVDFGCGKGRVICFAANHGCQNVIGVEYNDQIYQALSENVVGSRQRAHIRIVHGRAETLEIDQRLNKCFFYNPFYLKYFIKIYNNIMNFSRAKSVLLFMYDAAEEYRRFLNRQKNAVCESRIRDRDSMRELLVYRVSR